MTKKCSNCSVEKPLTDFYKDKANKTDGRYPICKTCKNKKTEEWRETNRDHYNAQCKKWRHKNPGNLYASEIKRRYKCTLEQYNQMLKEQDFKCAICGTAHDSLRKRGRLYVDHCHDTLKIRALLCNLCNSGIGYFRHSKEFLLKAAQYCSK